jgi:signal transduction histidine kinase
LSSGGTTQNRTNLDGDSSDGVRIAAPYDSDPAVFAAGGVLDDRAFHKELRKRNVSMLLWTALVFNVIYLGWGLFDYILVPDLWLRFLSLRVIAVVITTTTVAVVSRPRFRKYSFEGFWVLAVVDCAFIGPMLPLAGDEFSKYIMGLSIVMMGVGVIPTWPPRWTVAALLVGVIIVAGCFFPFWTGSPPMREVVANSFVLVTAFGLAVVASLFKYDLARRDFMSRVQLAEVARRESEARMVLARTSDDLQGALEKLKELDRLKSQFFANISHELRTPLTLILAPLSELASIVTGAEGRQQVRVIRRNAERLLGLINDLLDLSSLDAGGLRLNLAEMDVRSVAASVHENSVPAALAEDIEFKITCDSPPSRIWGDAHRLEIVMTNLVSNALKFTPRGGWIEIRVADLAGGVQIEVEDSGVGIPEDDLPRVFERFFQANPTDRRREGGVGIGLALAKELVELHGGTIGVDSPSPTGTIFTVFLPFGRDHIRPEVIERRQQFAETAVRRRSDDASDMRAGSQVYDPDPDPDPVAAAVPPGGDYTDGVEPVPFVSGRRPRILLAEDNPEVREFIRTLLDPRFEVTEASDGASAWKMLQSVSPDLVVSDVMMPEMSGTELCRAIKNDPSLKSIPVILLTAKVGSEATLDAYAHGADDFVAKPFHPRVLMARIRAQLNLRALALHLAQQEKLAVVGTMSAGILHEVRNPVNAILNASRAMASKTLDDATQRQLLEVIGDAAVRIEEITAALDTHARPAEAGETAACDLREGVEATFKLIRHRLDGVTIHRDFSTDRLARAPAGPMNQVLLNLVDNAVRMGAKNLWVSIQSRENTMIVNIGDDGPGVPKTEVDRLFDPFFTRRPLNDGTGLGLFLSRKMAEDAGGSLLYKDRSGGGALFVVTIPALPLEPGKALDED